MYKKAIELLPQKELENACRAASAEVDPAFEIIAFDGLDDDGLNKPAHLA